MTRKQHIFAAALAVCLSSFTLAQPGTPAAPSPPLNPVALRQRAVEVLVRAAVGENPALRSNAIEGMMSVPERALPVTQRGLSDRNPGVRFAAVVAAAMQRLKSLVPAIEPLLHDADASVRAAALYGLHTLGRKVDITPMADMLQSQDPRLRANVALLLGLMGDETAAPMLRRAAASPMPRVSAAQVAVVRIQIAEAIAKLGADDALDALRAGAFSQFDEVRVLAVTALGAVGDRRSEIMLEQLLRDPPVELQLATAAALARMGSAKGREAALKHAAAENPVLRGQVAWSLGWFDDPATLAILERLMGDSDAMVRVAAAAAVVRRGGAAVGAGAAR